MLPDWLKQNESYEPPLKGGSFINKTLLSLGESMARIKVQHGHEKGHALPAALKLIILVGLILLVSISHNRLILMTVFAGIHLYLSTWPAHDLPQIFKPAVVASILSFIILLPAMIMNPDGRVNNAILILKVFMSMEMVNIFNHTTQWNHITTAMRKYHIPGIFIFTLDLTLKYIVILGQTISNLMTALKLRSVGQNNKEYQSIGGVMGVTFMHSTQMSKDMYDAMRCRGFTDDYKGL